MKLSVSDIIRRGFENVIANWPLILIRVAEGILFIIIVVVSVVAAIVPTALSLGLSKFEAANANDAVEMITGILLEHWPVIFYLFGLIIVVFLAFIAIHSFVEAGSARVYVDAERAAPRPMADRAHFRTFTADRWFGGARDRWWQVFWIYNLAWTVACIILLVPLLITGVVMFALRDSGTAVAVTGCVGLGATMLLLIVVGIVTNIWCQKAIVVTTDRHVDARAALSVAWRQFIGDAGRHVAVAAILYVIMIAGTLFFSSFSAMPNFNHSAGFALTVLPLQLIGSFLNTLFSSAMASWLLACFAGLSVEARR